tara:strand:- start:94 stop:774 length:681 start_codon:yes stop_codon:yes gene_type:complete
MKQENKKRIDELIYQSLLKEDKPGGCGCGCGGCKNAPMLTESKVKKALSEGLQYHIDNKISLSENVYRIGSKAYMQLFTEARKLYSRNLLNVSEADEWYLTETHIGEFGVYEDVKVPLDIPMINEEQLDEKKKSEKKDPPLGKPKRGGSKAYYVYVRDPKTKRIKKVSFGSGGLRAKIRNPKARKAFAARHNCKNKKDRTKASYWSCNLPRYAPQLGLGAKMNTFW